MNRRRRDITIAHAYPWNGESSEISDFSGEAAFWHASNEPKEVSI